MMRDIFFLSMFAYSVLESEKRAVSVDKEDLKPCCVLLSRLSVSKCSVSWDATTFSSILEKTYNKDIGR